jgi:two-component system cell cycle sensor histidine kinase/response regulator CckA
VQETLMSMPDRRATSDGHFARGSERSATRTEAGARAPWLAAIACGAAFLLTLGLQSIAAVNSSLLFIAAIAVAAAVGGKGPARVATAASIVGAGFFFFHPRYALLPVEAELLRLAVFIVVAVLVLCLSQRLYDGRAKAERELRAIVSAMSDAIVVIDEEGRIVRVVESSTPLRYGLAAEIVGRRLDDLLSGEDAQRGRAHIQRALSERRTVQFDYAVTVDSSSVWFAAAVSPLTESTVVWVARDVTGRRQAEDSLRSSEARYRLLFELNPLPMWVFDEETRHVLAVNEAAIDSYGFPRYEFVGLNVDAFASGCASTSGYAAERHRCSTVCEHRRRNGTVMDVEVRSFALEFDGRPARLVAALDLTERLRLETRLRQSQRLEAVGQLAGGIAHDFNNVLTAITNYASVLIRDLKPGDSRRDDVGEILKATERAAGLTRQLLAFSRRQIVRPHVFSPNAPVEDLEKMLRRVIPEKVILVTVLDPDVGHVRASASQLEQVVLNLVVNARDAMPEGGTITITTRNVDLEEPYATPHVAVEPGRYVALSVNDTGNGMDADTQARIFEPFFTTKPAGTGTGLGLSTVYGIVKQSAGYVWCCSAAGRGTTFHVYLPRVDSPLDTDIHPRQLRDGVECLEPRCGSGQTVLVVDDDKAVRAATARALRRAGYSVLEAASGEEALSLCGRRVAAAPGSPETGAALGLVVTDLSMPGIGGRDLAARLAFRYPALPILFMSGHTADAALRQRLLPETARFIEKPFALDVFVQTVRCAVEGARLREVG